MIWKTNQGAKIEKIDKLHYVRIKNFRALNGSQYCEKANHGLDKIFANQTPNTGLISRLYIELSQLNNNKTNNPNKNEQST